MSIDSIILCNSVVDWSKIIRWENYRAPHNPINIFDSNGLNSWLIPQLLNIFEGLKMDFLLQTTASRIFSEKYNAKNIITFLSVSSFIDKSSKKLVFGKVPLQTSKNSIIRYFETKEPFHGKTYLCWSKGYRFLEKSELETFVLRLIANYWVASFGWRPLLLERKLMCSTEDQLPIKCLLSGLLYILKHHFSDTIRYK